MFGGGMFGAPKPATPTPAAGGGMFGGGGGFGAQQQQQQPQQQQQQQQQQTFQPGQSTAQGQSQNGGIGPKTKFTELPEQVQKIIEGIE